jgi:spore maturation protein CgeB
MKVAPRIVIVCKRGGWVGLPEDLALGFQEQGARVEFAFLRINPVLKFLGFRNAKMPAIQQSLVQERVAQQLARLKPQLVIIVNHPSLPPAAASLWRTVLPPGTPLVGWIIDHCVKFSETMPAELDLVYCFETASLTGLRTNHPECRTRFEYLPVAVNPHSYYRQPRPAEQRQPRWVFAGNCTPDRRAAIAQIRASGLAGDVFGPHGPDRHKPWRNRPYSRPSLARLYGDYLMSLNLLQIQNVRSGVNPRAFEIACAGGIGTYPAVADISSCFVPDREVLVYRSPEELREWLAMLRADCRRADCIVRAGQARCLAEHTYRHRAARILGDLGL